MNRATLKHEVRAINDEIAVSVRHVDMRYDKTYALKDASFDLQKGKFLTILGPSGSGKTTLLRLIAGFSTPTTGDIFINNQPVKALPAHKRAIGMVFQRLALFPHMTAAQNVAFPLKMRRYDARTIAKRVEEYLDLVRLGGYGTRRVDELSGGQQQRVAIARALVFEPDLLLLDEPLAALDVKLRQEMQLEFRRIQRELGVTTINVTHDQREALVVSDEIIVMNDGVVQQKATPIDTYRAPHNAFVANFIGVTNFLSCQIQEQRGKTVMLLCGKRQFEVMLEQLPKNMKRFSKLKVAVKTKSDTHEGDPKITTDALTPSLHNQNACLAAIRGEQIRIADTPDKISTLHMCLAAKIEDSIFEGERIVYEVKVADLNDMILRIFDHDPLTHNQFMTGDRVYVGWNNDDMQLFAAH